MKCQHKQKKFLGMIDYRGYPEKLFLCETCGMTISDYISKDDLDRTETDSVFETSGDQDVFDRFGDPYKHLHNEIL